MSSFVTNIEAYNVYISNDRCATKSVRVLIETNHQADEDHDAIRLKFKPLLSSREIYRKKKDLDTWNSLIFHSASKITSNPWLKQISLDPGSKDFSSLTISERINFSEDLILDSRKNILDCTLKYCRSKLSSLLEHIKFLAERENIHPKQLTALALQLVSNESYDRDTSQVCREIVNKSSYSGVLNNVSIPKSAYLLDCLEIGASKYTHLKKVLKADVKLPSYKLVSHYRKEITLVDEIETVRDPEGYSIGTCVSYHSILKITVQRLISTLEPIPDAHYPLKVKISDGLDGSGSHRIYNQQSNNPVLSTKSFILFGFKLLSITDTHGNDVFYNQSPNSPFCFRPVALIALKEEYSNVKITMDSIVNPQTDNIIENGLTLDRGHAQVEIIRSLFDTKMAGLLDGAGGASSHLCTATDTEINSVEWVRCGFPMNRPISDSWKLFEDVDEDEFLKLPSNQRMGITHKPTSDINILSDSPLHAYLCVFRWFMLLIYHLDVGYKQWLPSHPRVKASMKRIQALLIEKCSLSVDIPSNQGGTSTTGNIARDCFMDRRDFLKWTTSSINSSYKPSLEKIQTNLSVVLRLVNSGD